eukprot:EG_transcript_7242
MAGSRDTTNDETDYSAAMSLAAVVDQVRVNQPATLPAQDPNDIANILRHYYHHWDVCTQEQRDYYTQWAPVVFQLVGPPDVPAPNPSAPTSGSSSAIPTFITTAQFVAAPPPAAHEPIPVLYQAMELKTGSVSEPVGSTSATSPAVSAPEQPISPPTVGSGASSAKVVAAAPSINPELLEARKRQAQQKLMAQAVKPKLGGSEERAPDAPIKLKLVSPEPPAAKPKGEVCWPFNQTLWHRAPGVL